MAQSLVFLKMELSSIQNGLPLELCGLRERYRNLINHAIAKDGQHHRGAVTMNPYRIVLAEDHSLVRAGLKEILSKDPGLTIIGEVGDGLDLLEFLKKTMPDMVMLDISMPRLDGMEALKEIKALYPELKVLILTIHKSRDHLLDACSAGADGYLLKGNASNDLLEAVEKIREGGRYISTLMADPIVDFFKRKSALKLSSRELMVLEMLSQGKTSKQIAEKLSISLPTVSFHRFQIKKKLNIKTNAGLIKYAFQKGFVSSEED